MIAMNFFGIFFILGLFHNNEAYYNYDVVDYLTRFFEKYDYSKISYFIIDCDSSGIEKAINVVRNLNSKWPDEKMNVITTSYSSQHTGLKSMIFTSSVNQLEEALERYSCNSTLTYNSELPKPTDFLSILSAIIDQMHYNETIFLFTEGERNGYWPDALRRKLKDKDVQINAVLSDESTETDPFVDIIRNFGGIIFPYRIQVTNTWHVPVQVRSELELFAYNYKIKSIKKDNLRENSRIIFPLPEGTIQITLTIHGILQKALLVSPSGIMMNLLPIQPQAVPSKRVTTTADVRIFESPADWILSASGIKYNATMTVMMKTRTSSNEQMHYQKNVQNTVSTHTNAMNENSLFSPYRSHLEPNKDQWTEDSQPNSALMKRYNTNNNNNDDYHDHDERISPYNVERSDKVRLTENMQEKSAQIRPYDDDGSLSTSASQNRARIGTELNQPFTSFASSVIDVDIVSTFYVYPGEEARIVFNVRNNKEVPSKYVFNCHYMNQPCSVYPLYASLLPQEHVQVIVTVRASSSDGSSSIVGLISMSESIMEKKVYLFIGRPRSDSRKPDIDYEYNGNCDDANTGNTCLRKRWSANVVARDRESGLLNFWSEPQGMIPTSEFIVGTKEDVTARYTASCCNPKVDILASDLQGNTYRLTLNVEHQYLSAIEIITILLGAIIIILLVSGIVFGIMKWRRRNKETSFLKRSPTQRYNAEQ